MSLQARKTINNEIVLQFTNTAPTLSKEYIYLSLSVFLDLHFFSCRIGFKYGQILILGQLVHANDQVPFSSVRTQIRGEPKTSRSTGESGKFCLLLCIVLLFYYHYDGDNLFISTSNGIGLRLNSAKQFYDNSTSVCFNRNCELQGVVLYDRMTP